MFSGSWGSLGSVDVRAVRRWDGVSKDADSSVSNPSACSTRTPLIIFLTGVMLGSTNEPMIELSAMVSSRDSSTA